MANDTRIQKAAKHLNATELADGRWAHYADETSRWYVVTAAELEELVDYLDHEDEQIRGDAYSHWCAGTAAKEMPEGWEPGQESDDGPTDETTKTYTYTIFDANPNSSSGTEWPSHENIKIEADSDDEAIDEVRDVMSTEAAELNTSDGYDVGDTLHAIIWDEDGTIIGTPTYELTAEDLGVEDHSDLLNAIEDLTFHMPPECRGQIVERSFACDADYIYMRVLDRSDRSEEIVVFEHPEEESSFEPWNQEPSTGDEVKRVEVES